MNNEAIKVASFVNNTKNTKKNIEVKAGLEDLLFRSIDSSLSNILNEMTSVKEAIQNAIELGMTPERIYAVTESVTGLYEDELDRVTEETDAMLENYCEKVEVEKDVK